MSKRTGYILVGVSIVTFAVIGAFLAFLPTKPQVSKVVLLSIDALRADRLGCYGYPRDTSPHLDALAKESLLFEKAFSQAPWTGPSMSSVFTGHYPIETGMYRNRDRLDPQFPMLAELFQEKGFRTASLNTHSLLLGPFAGFLRGFDYASERQPLKVPYTQIEPDVMRWLDENAQSNFFLWIHNMDPHTPATEGNTYREGTEFRGYDAEVKWVDDAVGRLVDKLKALGIWDEVLFIFTADHGEAFGDHQNFGHQNVMYDEVLRVPLLIHYPGMKRTGKIGETVELLDLFATIGDFTGLEIPAGSRSESLLPIAEGHAEQRRKTYAFSSRYYFEAGYHELAVRDRAWKLIAKVDGVRDGPEGPLARPPQWDINSPATKLELYKIAQDPGEKNNLIGGAAPTDVVDRLRGTLIAWQKLVTPGGAGQRPAVEPDAATLELLRALGYED
jgi:arylsulfatase A-like enzyme